MVKRIKKIVFEDDSELKIDVKGTDQFEGSKFEKDYQFEDQFNYFDREILNHLHREIVQDFASKNFCFDCDCSISDYSDSDIEDEAENRGIYQKIEGIEFQSIVTDDLLNRFIQFINKSGTANAENVMQYLEKQFKL